jgi:hypothetical protein
MEKTMFVETGTVVFLSLIVLFWRLPLKGRLWLLGHPAWLEVPFGFLAYALHYGTFSGMMSAAVAAILCFGFTQAGRKLIGYIDGKKYHAGIWNMQVTP